MDTPRIYVACLAAYNNGILHGEWIDADQDVDNVHAEIQAMLANSPLRDAEEWSIHAFEGFGEKTLSEGEDIDDVVKFAEFIIKHGELGAVLLQEYSTEDAELLLDEHYHGTYDSEIDFAYAIFEDCYSHAMPKNLMGYFDYVGFTRDLFISDYFSVEADHKTHVFSNY